MTELRSRWLRYPLQAVNYLVFMMLVWYFSIAPRVYPLAENEAVVTMAFGHAGELKQPCRQLTAEELSALPPNMRKPLDCPRERSPVRVEMLMDNQPLFEHTAHPPGLYDDGSVDVYLSAKVQAGQHYFVVKINDNVRVDGYTDTAEQEVTVEPGQRLLVSYSAKDGFVFN